MGSGGREHALARAIAKSKLLEELYVAPGNIGTAELGTNIDIDPANPRDVLELAKRIKPDLTVVGPEAPLVNGVTDALTAAGYAVFGPSRAAATLEGSKAFAKVVMNSARVPTASSEACRNLSEAEAALRRFGAPYVVKQDGLAAGKGVVVTEDYDTALEHTRACIETLAHPAEPAVVIEEYLDGPEASVFCLCDGKTAVALPPAQDYKRVFDHNEGPNTGGMGAYSPLPWAPEDLGQRVAAEIASPILNEMTNRSTPFRGLLYVGLALTSRGMRVVEFNVRFGDPETQSVLERLDSDLLEYLCAAANGSLDSLPELRVSKDAVVNVVLAAPGYPQSPVKGGVIRGVEAAGKHGGVHIIHAGTARNEAGELVANGGRILSVVARGSDLSQARERAYQAMSCISLENGHYRSDIADF